MAEEIGYVDTTIITILGIVGTILLVIIAVLLYATRR